MFSRTTLVAMVFLGCLSNSWAQQSSVLRPYEDADSYQIFSLLIPHEQSYGFGDGTLVIREETVAMVSMGSLPTGPEGCVYPNVAPQFKEAIADYSRRNQHRWLLQRQFTIERPYEIVNSATLNGLSDGRMWKGFYRRYPNAGGILEMSAVGFNKERTRAIVYSGSSCGNLCGDWSFHLLQKENRSWKEVPGVSCHTVS